MNDYAKSISGITRLTNQEPYLTGKDVIVAVVDSGIDYRNREFLTRDGRTRLVGIWDLSSNQTEVPPPEGYRTGSFYSRDRIDEALALNQEQGYEMVPVVDLSGHGTAVTGVAAGTYGGIASESDILVIKINNRSNQLLTTSLLRGVDFAVKYGTQVNKPVVLNISIGNTYGDHQGNSLLERFLDNASEIGKAAFVVGSGNEGVARGHTAGKIEQEQNVQLAVAQYETDLLIQLWKGVQDDFQVTIVAPNGDAVTLDQYFLREPEKRIVTLGQTKLLCFLGVPLPYQVQQEFILQLLPSEKGRYIDAGIWTLLLQPVQVVNGQYRLYLSGSAVRNEGTGFLQPTPDITLTIPSTARKVITVGAYNINYQSYADFSGRGYVYRYIDQISQSNEFLFADVKPDLVAPGVNITVPTPRGGYEEVSGTSFAAPFVTGASALLMEYGIIRGVDPYLYGAVIIGLRRKFMIVVIKVLNEKCIVIFPYVT